MVDLAAIRSVLVVILVIGALGATGPQATFGEFSNAHDGTASWNATNDFPNNAGGPVADAGGPYSVFEGNSIELDGSDSTTSGGSIVSYDWNITSGNGSLSSTSGEQVTYNAPSDVQSDITVLVELEVTDDNGDKDTDTAEITVKDQSGCGATTLTFCSVIITDTGGGSYDVTYEVEDPAGGDSYDHVEVTLEEEKPNKYKQKDSATSQQTASTLSVMDNNGGGNTYRVRAQLYNASGSVVECREAIDTADGNGPSSITNC